jgi:hypothetical protein
MINMADLDSTVNEQTKLLKDKAINEASLVADQSLKDKKDPIFAVETFKNNLLQKGATSILADTEAVSYEARKANEIKNIATRDAQLLSSMQEL